MEFLNPIIAAVRGLGELKRAAESPVDTIFMLRSSLLTVSQEVEIAKTNGKRLFIHIDLMEGLNRDSVGMEYLANANVDGIITTRMNIISLAKEFKLKNVQRFFVVDSQSIETTIKSVKSCKPDMIELMPGVLFDVISRIKRNLSVPIIAGGLVENKKQVMDALSCGATAVSTGKELLWQA